jgi:hypothetical protein
MIAIVSSMPSSNLRPLNCNLSTVSLYALRRSLLAGLLLFLPALPAQAQTAEPAPASADRHVARRAADFVTFLAGGAIALGAHEGGHLVFDGIFDANPRLESVHFGPIPFFAVTHRAGLSPRREFTISSAGFWVQEGSNEWILTARPDLRHEHAPLVKGIFAFNVLTSIGYGTVAFAKAGPFERDTRGMSQIGVSEPAIGAIVIAPALLDAYRYFHPESKWAKWAARAAKIGGVFLVLK